MHYTLVSLSSYCVSESVSMCKTPFSWLIALDVAAQKHRCHVTSPPPHRKRWTWCESWKVSQCRQDVVHLPQNKHSEKPFSTTPGHFCKAGLKNLGFGAAGVKSLQKIVKRPAQSLSSSSSILTTSWNDVNLMAVWINKVTPRRRNRCLVFPYQICAETNLHCMEQTHPSLTLMHKLIVSLSISNLKGVICNQMTKQSWRPVWQWCNRLSRSQRTAWAAFLPLSPKTTWQHRTNQCHLFTSVFTRIVGMWMWMNAAIETGKQNVFSSSCWVYILQFCLAKVLIWLKLLTFCHEFIHILHESNNKGKTAVNTTVTSR